MSVSAVIVTRGNVDLRPVLDSLPQQWEQVVWNNSGGEVGASVSVRRDPRKHERVPGVLSIQEVGPDLAVYGRYAAIQHASHDLIYVQDDDCIVSDPQAIVDAWEDARAKCEGTEWDPRYLWHASSEDIRGIGLGQHVCCNMPQEFRHDFYADHGLVGFGAAFHRDAPARAFALFRAWEVQYVSEVGRDFFHRTCDIVFTTLTPRVLVDVPKENLSYAYDDSRMWRQAYHQEERNHMFALSKKARDL